MKENPRTKLARKMISGWNIQIPNRVYVITFWVLACSLLAIALLLRIYRIPEYLTFLSDQGRDAIILKRLVTLEKLVFVGPTTSIGFVFTGPFYYYLVAPFMWLWRLDPAGPAYGVALINSFGLGLIAFAIYRFFGRIISLLFLTILTFSVTQIWQSKFSWNPNPVSTFSFLTLIAFYLALSTRRLRWFAIAGLLLGFSLQLHYLTAILIAPLALAYIARVVQRGKARVVAVLPQVAVFVGACITTFIPLILFEVKNKFINLQTLLRARATGEVQAANTTYIERFNETIHNLYVHGFDIKIGSLEATLITLVVIILALLAAYRSRRMVEMYFVGASSVLLIVHVLSFSFLETGRHVHYYNVVYYPLYFLTVYVAVKAVQICVRTPSFRRALYTLLFAVLLQWSLGQVEKLRFLSDPPIVHTQLVKAKRVANYVIDNLSSDNYQIVGLPYYETIGHYRYFLEYYGRRPMPADSLGDPAELFVTCLPPATDEKDCGIAGNPQWQIADFQNRHPKWRVESKKQVDEAIVYKLLAQ